MENGYTAVDKEDEQHPSGGGCNRIERSHVQQSYRKSKSDITHHGSAHRGRGSDEYRRHGRYAERESF